MTQKSLTVQPPSDFNSAQSNIQSCISDTLSWMQSNKLKLNTEKKKKKKKHTPWDDACRFISTYQFGRLRVCRYRWKFAFLFRPSLRTLECILTKTLRCQWNNTSVASAALRFSHSGESPLFVRSSLTVSQKSSLRLMITSRLDYCNATFAGVADEQIARIQKIQNNAARLILKKAKRGLCHTAFERTPLAPL